MLMRDTFAIANLLVSIYLWPCGTDTSLVTFYISNNSYNRGTRRAQTSAEVAEPASSNIQHCQNTAIKIPSKIPDSAPWSGSTPKSNQLVPVTRPTPTNNSSKFVNNFLSYPSIDKRTKAEVMRILIPSDTDRIRLRQQSCSWIGAGSVPVVLRCLSTLLC